MGNLSWFLGVIWGILGASGVSAGPAVSSADSTSPTNLSSFLEAVKECHPSRWEQIWKVGALMITYEYRILGTTAQQKCHLEVWITKFAQESLPGMDITDVPEGSNYPQRQLSCDQSPVQMERMIRHVAQETYYPEDFLGCRRDAP